MTTNPPETNTTKRDVAEAALIKMFDGKVTTLDESAIPAINAHKDGTFGRSYLSYQLYNNGHNITSTSNHHPRGLFYNDGDNIFGIGTFFKPEEPDVTYVSIVAPHGKNYAAAVEAFCEKVEAEIPGAVMYTRQLTFEQTKELVNLDLNLLMELDTEDKRKEFGAKGFSWKLIDYRPWHPEAPREDETYQSSVINLNTLLREPKEGMFNNVSHPSADIRNNARKNYTSFERFLATNNLEYTLEPYEPQRQYQAIINTKDNANPAEALSGETVVRHLVQGHFDRLRDIGKAIGSTAADYEAIIRTSPEVAAEAGLHMFVGFLGIKGQPETRRPVSFFGFEEIGSPNGARTCGNYAGITTYDPVVLEGLPIKGETEEEKLRGFNRISTYANGQVFHALHGMGVDVVKVGGSETKDLDSGKRKLGAEAEWTDWLVRHPNAKWLSYLEEKDTNKGPPTVA